MSSYPGELPARPEGHSFKDRACPNARGCWSFSWSAFSLARTEPGVLLRRICMWIILVARTALSILSIIRAFAGGLIVWGIIDIILGVVVFFFIAWCLAVIGEAQGRRKVLGMTIVSLSSSSLNLYFLLQRQGHEIQGK